MINVKNGFVHGIYKKRAAEAGTAWRIHWTDGNVSIPLPTDAAYAIAKGNSRTIAFMENMDMEPFITQCINAMKQGLTMHDGQGLFFSYIGEDKYGITDPMLHDSIDTYIERDIRCRLQIYYTSKPQEMNVDKAYIEEWLGSAV